MVDRGAYPIVLLPPELLREVDRGATRSWRGSAAGDGRARIHLRALHRRLRRRPPAARVESTRVHQLEWRLNKELVRSSVSAGGCQVALTYEARFRCGQRHPATARRLPELRVSYTELKWRFQKERSLRVPSTRPAPAIYGAAPAR